MAFPLVTKTANMQPLKWPVSEGDPDLPTHPNNETLMGLSVAVVKPIRAGMQWYYEGEEGLVDIDVSILFGDQPSHEPRFRYPSGQKGWSSQDKEVFTLLCECLASQWASESPLLDTLKVMTSDLPGIAVADMAFHYSTTMRDVPWGDDPGFKYTAEEKRKVEQVSQLQGQHLRPMGMDRQAAMAKLWGQRFFIGFAYADDHWIGFVFDRRLRILTIFDVRPTGRNERCWAFITAFRFALLQWGLSSELTYVVAPVSADPGTNCGFLSLLLILSAVRDHVGLTLADLHHIETLTPLRSHVESDRIPLNSIWGLTLPREYPLLLQGDGIRYRDWHLRYSLATSLGEKKQDLVYLLARYLGLATTDSFRKAYILQIGSPYNEQTPLPSWEFSVSEKPFEVSLPSHQRYTVFGGWTGYAPSTWRLAGKGSLAYDSLNNRRTFRPPIANPTLWCRIHQPSPSAKTRRQRRPEANGARLDLTFLRDMNYEEYLATQRSANVRDSRRAGKTPFPVDSN